MLPHLREQFVRTPFKKFAHIKKLQTTLIILHDVYFFTFMKQKLHLIKFIDILNTAVACFGFPWKSICHLVLYCNVVLNSSIEVAHHH